MKARIVLLLAAALIFLALFTFIKTKDAGLLSFLLKTKSQNNTGIDNSVASERDLNSKDTNQLMDEIDSLMTELETDFSYEQEQDIDLEI